MKIVADQNIPRVEEAFSGLGEVVPVDGRALDPALLSDADVLLVRSISRVDEALLRGTKVAYVGSATSGIDHVDREYLERRGIGFAWAPGVNAQSVAEYIVAALLELSTARDEPLAGRTLGAIGCGEVGRRVVRAARALGLRSLVNDPPLADTGHAPEPTVPLDELLARSDIISLHVPLNRREPYATFHLVDERFLNALRPGAWLINTSRGAVVDTGTLACALESGGLAAVLDVWENEPRISPDLLERTALATPHIAGYSAEGKTNATETLYRAVCSHFGFEPAWRNTLPPTPEPVDLSGLDGEQAVRTMVRHAYDIRADDARLRRLPELPPEERPAYFDRLRAEYPVRREFAAWQCVAPEDARARQTLRQLGFQVLG